MCKNAALASFVFSVTVSLIWSSTISISFFNCVGRFDN